LLDQEREDGDRGNQLIVKHNSKKQVLNIVCYGDNLTEKEDYRHAMPCYTYSL